MLLSLNLSLQLDLYGSRDFLDADGARQALAPLLAAGASIKKVRSTCTSRSCLLP
jgi:hypothetical protein